MKKILLGISVIIIVCIVGIYTYTSIIEKNNFDIKQLSWSAEGKLWTDNSKHNKYDISFQTLNGSDIKEINSKKSTYDMKIDSSVTSGDLNLKIYNDNKVLFKESGSINKIITVDNNNSKNVKIEITGQKAKGHVIINLK